MTVKLSHAQSQLLRLIMRHGSLRKKNHAWSQPTYDLLVARHLIAQGHEPGTYIITQRGRDYFK